MCNADVTPVRNKWFPEAGVFGPDLSIKHTCRDIANLVKWSMARTSKAEQGSEIPVDQTWVVTNERPFVDVAEKLN